MFYYPIGLEFIFFQIEHIILSSKCAFPYMMNNYPGLPGSEVSQDADFLVHKLVKSQINPDELVILPFNFSSYLLYLD